ncbi:MAG: cobalamin B12-binding domain-containing protein [Solirubrobacteraceae bacterium]
MTGATGTARLRVVVAKVGLDGHDRGVKVIARGFRDAGMEVVYTGLRRSPEELAQIVLQEDADALGLSILSGAVVPLSRRVVQALRAAELDDVLVIVGGIVTPRDAEQLRALGIDGAFGPGTSLREIVDFTYERARVRRA